MLVWILDGGFKSFLELTGMILLQDLLQEVHFQPRLPCCCDVLKSEP